jgi:fumarylacetoacetate (FAA) hydrolase
MKLASLKGGRDGRLIVVSKDLSRRAVANAVAPTLQAALDNWTVAEPRLIEIAGALEAAHIADLPFDPAECAAPLPRAYQWLDGSAYVNHVALVRKARGAEMPASFWTDPLMYQGGSDDFCGPRDDIVAASEEWGIDFEAEVAVVTGDVAMGTSAAAAIESIRLVMLANDVSLRNLIPAELAKGFGFFQSKPATAFSPVAVTPDELGPAWHGGRLHLDLESTWNDARAGLCNAGVEMTFHFGQLIAHLCKTRNARAGSIVGSGTVSNKDWARGYSCIAEKRAIETIEGGAPQTPFMRFGDTIRIEMKDPAGVSIFGAIDQKVARA